MSAARTLIPFAPAYAPAVEFKLKKKKKKKLKAKEQPTFEGTHYPGPCLAARYTDLNVSQRVRDTLPLCGSQGDLYARFRHVAVISVCGSHSPSPLLPYVDKYELTGKSLGSGSFSTVEECRQLGPDGRLCAAKIVDKASARSPTRQQVRLPRLFPQVAILLA